MKLLRSLGRAVPQRAPGSLCRGVSASSLRASHRGSGRAERDHSGVCMSLGKI